MSICTAWHSPECRNGCLCDKYTRQTDCSKAGVEPAGATRDLAFARHKPLRNSAVQQIPLTTLLRDGEIEEELEGKGERDWHRRRQKKGRRIGKENSAGPVSNTASNEIVLYHHSNASAPSAFVLTVWGLQRFSSMFDLYSAMCYSMSNIFP